MEGSETLFLTRDELNLLVAAGGIRTWFGPCFSREKIISSKEEINRIIAGLYSKRFIASSSDPGGNVDGSIAKAIRIIGDAEICILIIWDDEGWMSYVYPSGRELVQIEVSRNDIETLGISVIDNCDWIEEFIESMDVNEMVAELRSNNDGKLKGSVSYSGDSGDIDEVKHTITGWTEEITK